MPRGVVLLSMFVTQHSDKKLWFQCAGSSSVQPSASLVFWLLETKFTNFWNIPELVIVFEKRNLYCYQCSLHVELDVCVFWSYLSSYHIVVYLFSCSWNHLVSIPELHIDVGHKCNDSYTSRPINGWNWCKLDKFLLFFCIYVVGRRDFHFMGYP